jgi:hypothetical protein
MEMSRLAAELSHAESHNEANSRFPQRERA